MELGLAGKRVLVAGASRGIGLAMCHAFLREGARVAMVARDAAPLSESAAALTSVYGEGRVLFFAADAAVEADWGPVTSRLSEEWDGLDVAVSNVGDGRGPAEALPEAKRFADSWRTNFTSAEMTARAILPLLEASNGTLLFISSIAGLQFVGAPTDYSVAKTAVIALSKQLATRLAPRVRVNCIAPGNIIFPGGSWDAKLRENRVRVEAIIDATVPMKRFGTPGEIADAALFLCSDRAAFVTGTCTVVDGGQTNGMR